MRGDSLDIRFGGAGSLKADGTVKKLKLNVGGVGSIDTRELHADTVDVSVGGVGSVKVWANQRWTPASAASARSRTTANPRRSTRAAAGWAASPRASKPAEGARQRGVASGRAEALTSGWPREAGAGTMRPPTNSASPPRPRRARGAPHEHPRHRHRRRRHRRPVLRAPLADAGHRILILEASSDRWGGRIETEDLDGFIAEMGPMRFEPTLQPRFAKLCAELGVELVDFAGPHRREHRRARRRPHARGAGPELAAAAAARRSC